MGKASRNKGKKGEREFRRLLADRDWIVANTADGDEVEDCWATDPVGVTYSVEIKNRKLINVREFRTQAMANAAKSRKPWMLAAKIEGTRSWLVLRKNTRPVVWHEKEAIEG